LVLLLIYVAGSAKTVRQVRPPAQQLARRSVNLNPMTNAPETGAIKYLAP